MSSFEEGKDASSSSQSTNDVSRLLFEDFLTLRKACDNALALDFLDETISFEIVLQAYSPASKEPPHGSKTLRVVQAVPVRHLLGSQDLCELEFIVPPTYPNAESVRRSTVDTIWGLFKIKYGDMTESLSVLPKEKENLKDLCSRYDVWFSNENKPLSMSVQFRNNKTIERVSFKLDMEEFPLTLHSLKQKSLSAKRYLMTESIAIATKNKRVKKTEFAEEK